MKKKKRQVQKKREKKEKKLTYIPILLRNKRFEQKSKKKIKYHWTFC